VTPGEIRRFFRAASHSIGLLTPPKNGGSTFREVIGGDGGRRDNARLRVQPLGIAFSAALAQSDSGARFMRLT